MEERNDILYEKILKKCSHPMSDKEILIDGFHKKEIRRAFYHLVDTGKLLPTKAKKSKKYANLEYFGIVTGKFLATDKGYAFVTPETPLASGRDIFIPEKYTKDAWHEDTVLVKLIKSRYKNDRKGERQEGQVVRIVKRSASQIVGKVVVEEGLFFAVPEKRGYPAISLEDVKSAKEGDLVAVKVTYFGNSEFMPQGKITEIFGSFGTKETSIKAILHTHAISESFPPMVGIQTSGIANEITEDMFDGRIDLTDKMIFTIDGDYSKDFDDAVSLEQSENGNLILGVHIADVSHYVSEGSPLDIEAYERGTSVYFANKVIPMLPFELSNGICSLNPNENRYAFSVFMEIDGNNDVVNSKFFKSVIKSKYRMTYNNVNKILDGNPELCEKYSEIVDILADMHKLSKRLEYKRKSKGYLDLDIAESYILCDENDVAIDVKLRARGESEKLIEQFMVLTNETVAKFMDETDTPSVYRIHEPPNMDKLKTFADVSRLFGFKISNDELSNQVSLQSVLTQSSGTPQQKIISTMLLRSLSKAKYNEKNIGHSGLASENYLHFTSPIRRYPDLVVHRMLDKKLQKQKFTSMDTDFVHDASVQSSERENHADVASRDIEKLYKAEYMSKFIGDVFNVSVSGVQNFGIFVELENTIEGLIRIDNLSDDEYIYDEEHIRLVGKMTKKIYTIGTPLKAKLVNASCINGQVDFVLEV